jgi:hypothetical protein
MRLMTWRALSIIPYSKDGRICESVVWDKVPSSQRHHIPALAVEFALKKNFAGAESVEWSCSLLVGTDGWCPLCYQTHFEPSFLGLNDTL